MIFGRAYLLLRGGGQGQDRTVDLPLFRRTLIPTELPDLGGTWLAPGGVPLQRAKGHATCPGGPDGIRTRAAALKGRCPRPLDDGGFGGGAAVTPGARRREPSQHRGGTRSRQSAAPDPG